MRFIHYQKGFTIVELLIVIVVIGILAALVLNSFAGVQQKARNTERQTDTKALATQLEAWYNGDGQGSYPTWTQVDTETEALAVFKGIDAGALKAPGKGFSLTSSVSPDENAYGYQAMNSAGMACGITTSPQTDCVRYRIYWKEEGDSQIQNRRSLNW